MFNSNSTGLRMILCLLYLYFSSSVAFVITGARGRPLGLCHQTRLFLLEEDQDQQVLFGSSESDAISSSLDTSSLFKSLQDRQDALKQGIGKRYMTRTQKGFLNVHFEPSDPFDAYNIVNQLQDGDIVTSTGLSRGLWIPHDGGGWSISKFGGFTWLEPIEE
jgi:hypothetical protein